MPVRVFLLAVSAAGMAAAPRIEKTINGDSTFQYFPAGHLATGPSAPAYYDAKWPAVALPHTWSTYETTPDTPLVVGKQFAGPLVAAESDGVQKYARVYLNGKLAGEHKADYTGFSVDLTPHLRFGEENVLAVQVSNRRDVRLVIRDRLHIPFQGPAEHEGATFVTTSEVTAERGAIKVRTWVRNDYPRARSCTLVTTILNAAGKVVAQSRPYKGQLTKDPREETRARIKSTLFVPERLPELKVEEYGRFEPAPGVVAERVSYATGYGLRVPAIVYRPAKAPAAKLPGFIVVNGHGGDKYSWYAWYAGILYARAGAVVLTYDPIGEGERNAQRKSGTRQHDRKVDPPEMARHMAGLMITDIMQAVSYLAQRPEVDGKRIAAAGYSMGSFILSLGCAVEPRLNACVLVGGGNLDGPGGYWDSSGKSMCQSIPYQSLAFLGDRGAAIYDLHASHAATLIFNGDADDVVAIPKMGRPFFEDLRKRTMALGGKQVFEFNFEPGGGHRPYFITRPVGLWLERRLAFPNWTAESIAAMPVTHIAEWAQAQNVPMDRLYATELREGGTRALGSGIPAVTRDTLNALPPERWEREKDKYLYESWLREAGARVGRRSDEYF